MTFRLQTVSFALNMTRLQPLDVTMQGNNADGTPADFSTVIHNKLVVSHAIGRDLASEIATFSDKFVVVGTVLKCTFTAADIEALPLGKFPAELVVTDDGVSWYVSHQGSISVGPNIYRP